MNKPTLKIVVGMAGSGKTAHSEKLKSEIKDDVKVFNDATSTSNNKKRAGHNCLGEIVARLLGLKKHCIVNEAHLVDDKFRKYFECFCDTYFTQVDIEWIYFEYNPLECINNVFRSTPNDKDRLNSLFNQIQNTNYAEFIETKKNNNSKVIEVFKGDDRTFEVEAKAIIGLKQKLATLQEN